MPSQRWQWVALNVAYAVHDRQLAEHGGLDGVRDQGAVESALARPQNLASYGNADAPALAACYAHGFARNHGFADGNKRIAWVLGRLFLADNGFQLNFDQIEAVKTMEEVAAGSLAEHHLAAWFRERLKSTD